MTETVSPQTSAQPVDNSDRYPYAQTIALKDLVKNRANPNEQDERTFNATVESIEEEGWIQPMATVVPQEDGTFQIVAGHHRVDAAEVLGYEDGPCWVLDPAKFDQDRQDWVMVKANMLQGALNPVKFTTLYNRMLQTYGAEVLQSLMGFTSEDAFQKVYRDVKRALPPNLQKALDDQKDEIKTIDDLSLVLNRLFSEYGETLPSNMMVFSWAGKEVLWVRTDDALWKHVTALAKQTARENGDMNAVLLERLTGQQATMTSDATDAPARGDHDE